MLIQCPGCFEKHEDNLDMCPYCGYVEGDQAAEALHMSPGAILADRYRIGRVLGFGGFGVTYLAWDMVLECKMAIKEYLPSEFSTRSPGITEITVFAGNKEEQFTEGLKRFVDEAKRLAKFQSEPGIVKIYDSFLFNNTAYIVMEYLEGETLTSVINKKGKIPADITIGYLTSIIKSLETVHGEGIIHRDIAPDNIMVTKNGEVKLIDFGAARYATTSHSRSLTVIIKPGYSPEEQYRSRGDQGSHTDVYATAAVMYRMITGITPPDALERRAYFENGKKDLLELPSKYDKSIPENVETALLNAMNVRIEDRTPDMATFFDELTSDEPVKRRIGKIKKIDVLRWPLWLKITVPTAVVAIVTLITLFALGIIGTPEPIIPDIIPSGMTRVVSVVNDNIDEAEKRAEDAFLQSSILKYQIDDMIPANTVMYQSQLAGTIVAINTMLDLTVSKGAEQVRILSYTGMNAIDAMNELEAAGFIVQKVGEYSDVIAEGSVISQSVEANEYVDYGSLITLTVSLGRENAGEIETKLIVVPAFVGKNYEDVLKEAAENGLIVSVKEREFSSEYPENVVMAQSINAGEEIINNNIIYLTVSGGIQNSKVPDVFGLTLEDAQKLIEDKGFSIEITEEDNEKYAVGIVFKQMPEAGEELVAGETVHLTVSTGAKAFAMEDITGLSEEEALSKIAELGLSYMVSYEKSSTVEPGKLISQSPKVGEQVKKGDVINIVVCTAEELIEIPNLSGKSAVEAGRIIKNLGLEITQTEVFSDTVEKGLICGQLPEAGKKLKKGGTVVINVSKGKEGIALLNYAGKTEAIAKEAIIALKLKVNVTYDYSDTVANGAVIGHTPEPGKIVYEGDEINLVVSKGKTPITLGNYVNKSSGDAKADLEKLGLSVTIQESFDDNLAKGNVISQNPIAQSTVYKGDIVILNVSKGQASVPVSSVTLNKSTLTLIQGSSSQLLATIAPENASDKKYSFSSGNTAVATVSNNGLVTAVADGKTTITVTTNNGSKTATCEVIVQKSKIETIEISTKPSKLTYFTGDSLDTTGLKLKVSYNSGMTEYVSEGFAANGSTATAGNIVVTVTYEGVSTTYSITVKDPSVKLDGGASLFVGDTATLKATIMPANNTATWSSSNTGVITVDSKGVIKGITKGEATITVSITYNGKTYSDACKCIVGDTGIVVDKTSIDLYTGDTQTLSAITNPSGQNVTWSTENSAVATVNGGVVTAVGGGKTNIVASISYSGSTYTCKTEVTVTQPSVTLSKSNLDMLIEGSDSVSATTVPAGQKVTWSVDKIDIATVNNGTVKGVSDGTATLTCSFEYAGKTYSSSADIKVNRRKFKLWATASGGSDGLTVYSNSFDVYEKEPLENILKDIKPELKGYEFTGWSYNSGTVMPASDLSISGYFKAKPINIAVDYSNCPDPNMRGTASVTLTYDTYLEFVLGGQNDPFKVESDKHNVIGYDIIAYTWSKTGNDYIYNSTSGGAALNVTGDNWAVGNVTVYAQYDGVAVVANFMPEGGVLNSGEETLSGKYNSIYNGSFPVPTKDYCNFEGWYTEQEGGSLVTENTTINYTGSINLYAHWTDKPTSDWVLETELPTDAKVVENKWMYTLTDTVVNYNTSYLDYAVINTEWEESGRGSTEYASFPGGFDTGNWIYTSLAKGPYSTSETATYKRTVSNSWSGYVYWHWMYNTSQSSGIERVIRDSKGTASNYRNYAYQYFSAFKDATNYTCVSKQDTTYNGWLTNCNNRNDVYKARKNWSYSDTTGSCYWFRFDYYTSSYIDYVKKFTHQKVTYNNESATEMTNGQIITGGTVSGVQKYVKYVEK